MTPQALIERLQLVPHVPGGSDWNGADCWGIVCIWYRERFGIELKERHEIDPGVSGMQAGFDARRDWSPVSAPRDDDVVVMRAAKGRVMLDAGHIGIHWRGLVIHSSEGPGCVAVPLASRQIRHRITGYFRHRSML